MLFFVGGNCTFSAALEPFSRYCRGENAEYAKEFVPCIDYLVQFSWKCTDHAHGLEIKDFVIYGSLAVSREAEHGLCRRFMEMIVYLGSRCPFCHMDRE